NFLGISTQTEVAQAHGNDNRVRAMEITSLGIMLSGFFGLIIISVGLPFTSPIASVLG
ncbi:MAG TPA: MATE family efflux transporter, partial [Candidatus Latescibacteria bacterium]|nr:MATE family efflux transporter [Candidatus Latescibacterota bacterium]